MMGDRLHQPLRLEMAQDFTHDRPADAELLAQITFGEPCPWRKAEFQDGGANPFQRDFAQGLRRLADSEIAHPVSLLNLGQSRASPFRGSTA